jgi:hypothetical protein
MPPIEKKKEYNKIYYLNNAEKLKKYQREYRDKKKTNFNNERINKNRKMNESLVLYFD